MSMSCRFRFGLVLATIFYLAACSSVDTAFPDAGDERGPDVVQGSATTDAGDAPRGPNDAGVEAPQVIAPDQSGTFAVTREELTLAVGDESSSADVTLHLFSPREVDVAPVVLFHPGFQLAADNYFSYGEHLASQGIFVIFVDPPDALFGGPTHAEMATYLGDVLDWLHEQNLSEGFGFSVDESRIGLAGHSMGGKISFLFASQDTRPVAVAGIDPVDAVGGPFGQPSEDNPSVTPERMAQIGVPLLLIGETLNATCEGVFCQPCAPAEDNFQQYFEHATSPVLEIEVLGANHMSFLDDPNCGFTCSVCPAGSDNPAQTRDLTHKYLSAFFQHRLLGRESARAWLTGPNIAIDVQENLVRTRTKNAFQ